MKKSHQCILRSLLLGGICIGHLLTACSLPMLGPPGRSPLTPSSRQLVVVRTPDWGTAAGTLQRYRRDPAPAPWQPVGPPIPVTIGRNGLAWGVGLAATGAPGDAPLKREGDGKAPAGAFAFDTAFGYAPPGSVPWIRMPYVQAESAYKCVDDTGSRHYNRLLFEDRVNKDWTSSEEMLRPDDLYRLGLVVEHNWGPQTQSGLGSCIFLHIWAAPDKGTAGCTAMDPGDVESLLGWLDPALHPLLVQLPEQEYIRLQEAWGLP
ncbi:MAG: L,D-transpeptidase family protein [Syntrophales bacterium]